MHLHVKQMEFLLRAMLSPQLPSNAIVLFFFIVFKSRTSLKEWTKAIDFHQNKTQTHCTCVFCARSLCDRNIFLCIMFFLLLPFCIKFTRSSQKEIYFWFKAILTCIQQEDSVLSWFPAFYRNAVSRYPPGISLQHEIVSWR